MDAVDIARILARRWYITVVGLVLLALGVSLISGQVDSTYSSSTDVLLLTPGVNPNDPELIDARTFFNAPVALGNAGISLTRSDQRLIELSDNGYSTDFTITGDREGSIYQIVAEAPTPENAVASVNAITTAFSEALTQVQDDARVPGALHMDIQQIREPSIPAKLTGDLRKLQAGATGIGAVIIVVLVLAVNALLERRARKQEQMQMQMQDQTVEIQRPVVTADEQADEPRKPRRWGT